MYLYVRSAQKFVLFFREDVDSHPAVKRKRCALLKPRTPLYGNDVDVVLPAGEVSTEALLAGLKARP